ncbi:MAG: lysine exporter LysO family protein [Paludibacter sp.]|nr:lysine exporter LysO family protein [Paludibacter sp.]
MKGSIIILSFFAAGLLLGVFRIIPDGWYNVEYSMYILCALMFAVGFSIGNQPETIKQFKNLPARVVFLPLTTIVGTWAGAVVVGLMLDRSLTDYLAIGSGLGYYSLSSILITQYKGIELGTIALLANIFREVLALLFVAPMAKYAGKLAPIAAGGATTMDTTFPGIVRYSGKEYAIVSIYHGFITDLSVPFFVTLWCSIKF